MKLVRDVRASDNYAELCKHLDYPKLDENFAFREKVHLVKAYFYKFLGSAADYTAWSSKRISQRYPRIFE